jgi:hypothetical protein
MQHQHSTYYAPEILERAKLARTDRKINGQQTSTASLSVRSTYYFSLEQLQVIDDRDGASTARARKNQR